MDAQIATLKAFPFGKTLDFYRRLCDQDPSQRLACDPNFRAQSLEDLEALQQARAAGVLLNLPVPPPGGGGDYDVSNPFVLTGSLLMKQWTVIQQGIIKAQQAAQAAGAVQAANLAAQNAAAAAAQAAALAAGETPAQAAAAGQAAAAKVAAQQAAAALAAQQQANANAPQLGVVNGNLVSPTGMTLYAMNANPPPETAPTGIQCTGACMQVWTAADPSWIGANPAVKCKLTSFLRPDGVTQLACGVMPMYTFNSDKKPGDIFGLGNPAFNQAVNAPSTNTPGGA